MQRFAPAMLRENAVVAYVFPFAAYLVLGSIAAMESLANYYPWAYAAQMAVSMGVWWAFRKRYPAIAWKGVGLAVLVGVVGVILWVTVCHFRWEESLFGSLPSWLYSSERVGFNPFDEIENPAGQYVFILIRLAGLSIVVPLAEEVFWRGFLIRYLISDDFEGVPLGKYTLASFGLVTALFAAAHPEILAALLWGAGINVLLYRTKNLWSCIVAHGVTNLLLGVYILTTHSWILW